MTSNVSVSPLSSSMAFDSRNNVSGKGAIELPSVLTLPLSYNSNSESISLKRRISSESSSVSSSNRYLSQHSLPFKKRKFQWISIETDDDQNENKEDREKAASLVCISPVVGAFPAGMASTTAATANSCTDATSADESNRSLCGSDVTPDHPPQPQKPWIATTPGLGIVVPVVSSSHNDSNGSTILQRHKEPPPHHTKGSPAACITPVPGTSQPLSNRASGAVAIPTLSLVCQFIGNRIERDASNGPTISTPPRLSHKVDGSGGSGIWTPIAPTSPIDSSSRPKRAPRDRLYRGSGSSNPTEVRCLAISTRGKRCCYAAVDFNGNRYCNRHSSFYGEMATVKDQDTPKDPSKNDSKKPQGTQGYAATAASKREPGRAAVSKASSKRNRQRTVDPAPGQDGPRPPTALGDLSTDLWQDRMVKISKGPHEAKVGTVVRWRNGWVTVGLETPGGGTNTTYHNRRSYELFLV